MICLLLHYHVFELTVMINCWVWNCTLKTMNPTGRLTTKASVAFVNCLNFIILIYQAFKKSFLICVLFKVSWQIFGPGLSALEPLPIESLLEWRHLPDKYPWQQSWLCLPLFMGLHGPTMPHSHWQPMQKLTMWKRRDMWANQCPHVQVQMPSRLDW